MTKKGDKVYVIAWAYEGYLEGTAVFKGYLPAEEFVAKLKRNCQRRKAGDRTLDLFIKQETIQ